MLSDRGVPQDELIERMSRLSPLTPPPKLRSASAGAPGLDVPDWLIGWLDDEPSGRDRSGDAYHLAAVCCELGLDDTTATALVCRYRPAVDKYGDRIEREARRAVDKARVVHNHVGKWCIDAGCPNTPEWQKRRGRRCELSTDEWAAEIYGAYTGAAADPPTPPTDGNEEVTSDPPPGPPTSPTALNLPVTFWDARPELSAIRQAAHARGISADAVLGAVVARIAWQVSPAVTLPPVTGDVGSLDFCVATIGRSGAGKTVSQRCAAQLIPGPALDPGLDELPLGSGEGLIDAYFGTVLEDDGTGKKTKRKRQVRRGVLFNLDEGQALDEVARRKGSTLMPTIRTGWSGGRLGQALASEERSRHLPHNSYRFALIAGFQPEYAAQLLSDAAGGTPQRFLYVSASDLTIPEDPPPWPRVPLWEPSSELNKPLTVVATVSAEIRQRSLGRARGTSQGDPLDAHRDLLRLKISGLLTILDHRTDINGEVWHLAGMMLDTSDAVRRSIQRAAADQAEKVEQARIVRQVRASLAVDRSTERRALERVALAIARHVHKKACDGGCRRRCVTLATSSHDFSWRDCWHRARRPSDLGE
jgi:hypothetical protein